MWVFCYYFVAFVRVLVMLLPAELTMFVKNCMMSFVMVGNAISTTPKMTAAITSAYVDQEMLPIASGIV